MQVKEPFNTLDLILGCMFSNKTTELLRRLEIYKEMGLKVILVNSRIDTRSETDFSTHNQLIANSRSLETLKINDLTNNISKLSQYDVIGIDEASFFHDLRNQVLNLVDNFKRKVIVAGLNGDSNRKDFGQVNELIPHCDSLVKLSAFCQICCDKHKTITLAHFTKRIVSDNSEILVGGKESYIPVCRVCYMVGNPADKP